MPTRKAAPVGGWRPATKEMPPPNELVAGPHRPSSGSTKRPPTQATQPGCAPAHTPGISALSQRGLTATGCAATPYRGRGATGCAFRHGRPLGRADTSRLAVGRKSGILRPWSLLALGCGPASTGTFRLRAAPMKSPGWSPRRATRNESRLQSCCGPVETSGGPAGLAPVVDHPGGGVVVGALVGEVHGDADEFGFVAAFQEQVVGAAAAATDAGDDGLGTLSGGEGFAGGDEAGEADGGTGAGQDGAELDEAGAGSGLGAGAAVAHGEAVDLTVAKDEHGVAEFLGGDSPDFPGSVEAR